MRRSAWIFLAAILLPSLVLAALAVRSARDQQVVLEHQQAVISQDITDALAKKIQEQLDNSKTEFIQATQRLLAQSSLRYRRQILALKHYFARHNSTVIMLDDLTAEIHQAICER